MLLSHGFTGSPFSIKPWARALAEKGYAVEVPRLPGHGTTWQEMNRRPGPTGTARSSRSFAKLRSENDAVVVGGLSMGAALVLQLAAEHDAEIDRCRGREPRRRDQAVGRQAPARAQAVVPSFPAIANDIKKPGQDEYGYPRPRSRRPTR